MAEDRPEDTGPSPDSRPKRAPPTIDLEATEVATEPHHAGEPAASADTAEATLQPEAKPEPEPQVESQPEPQPETASAAREPEPARPVSPWVVAPLSGAVAAALVIGVGWLLGWPQVAPASAPQSNAAALDELTGRVAGLESKLAKPASAAGDPAAAARLEALDKSIAALRSELTAQRAQSDKLAAAANAPRAAAPAPDLSGITGRIDRIEGALKAQNAEIAKQDGKLAEAKPADDTPLRRVVAASLLDTAVRHGDPFVAALTAAKSFADDPNALKPLEAFAASGVPDANALCRELIEIVPKLTPPAQASSSGAGLVDRLQAEASKLVRIERVDATSIDRGSAVARVTSAAVHNDLALTERELKALPAADRTAAQGWLDKVDARRAALAASRAYADNAMAALATVNQ